MENKIDLPKPQQINMCIYPCALVTHVEPSKKTQTFFTRPLFFLNYKSSADDDGRFPGLDDLFQSFTKLASKFPHTMFLFSRHYSSFQCEKLPHL